MTHESTYYCDECGEEIVERLITIELSVELLDGGMMIDHDLLDAHPNGGGPGPVVLHYHDDCVDDVIEVAE